MNPARGKCLYQNRRLSLVNQHGDEEMSSAHTPRQRGLALLDSEPDLNRCWDPHPARPIATCMQGAATVVT